MVTLVVCLLRRPPETSTLLLSLVLRFWGPSSRDHPVDSLHCFPPLVLSLWFYVFFLSFLGLLPHFDGAHPLTTDRERLWRSGFSSPGLWILHVSSLTPDILAGCGTLSEVIFPPRSGGIPLLLPLPVLLVAMVPLWFPIFCMWPFPLSGKVFRTFSLCRVLWNFMLC